MLTSARLSQSPTCRGSGFQCQRRADTLTVRRLCLSCGFSVEKAWFQVIWSVFEAAVCISTTWASSSLAFPSHAPPQKKFQAIASISMPISAASLPLRAPCLQWAFFCPNPVTMIVIELRELAERENWMGVDLKALEQKAVWTFCSEAMIWSIGYRLTARCNGEELAYLILKFCTKAVASLQLMFGSWTESSVSHIDSFTNNYPSPIYRWHDDCGLFMSSTWLWYELWKRIHKQIQ